MNVNKFLKMPVAQELAVYGDTAFRGDCPKEDYALKSFFDYVRKKYPDTWAKISFHVKNEGKRTRMQAKADALSGLTLGVSDVIIVGKPMLCLELKRNDPTLADITDAQIAFLLGAKHAGAHVAIALGYEAAVQAFEDWIKLQ